MSRVRGASNSSAIKTTTGRVLAAMPRSASQTSPWRGFIAVDDVQHLLLNFAAGEHVRPIVLRSLTFEEFEIMPQLAQDWLWLILNLLDQPFLCAHAD